MQRILFARLELWAVLLLLLVVGAGAVLFGGLVLLAERTPMNAGRVERLAHTVAETPLTLRDLIRKKDTRIALRTGKLAGKAGWVVADGGKALAGEGYLLLSRYDGDAGSTVVELVDLADQQVRYRWQPDADGLFADIPPDPRLTKDTETWNRWYFEAYHPYLLPSGNLIIKGNGSPLFSLDHCSRVVWSEQSAIYHHSTEADADGNLWVPIRIQPPNPDYGPDFSEDGLAQVSPDGKVLNRISLVDLFLRHGLEVFVFGTGPVNSDPLHLNDIQPVLADGPHWKKGDLFINLRHYSMVLLYRPSTDQILWYRNGPWLGQHDVDILDDHRISVFNNNTINRGRGPDFAGPNEVLVYDFDTGLVTSPYRKVMTDLHLHTNTEGLKEITQAGNLLVEEENSGHLVILSPISKILAEYVNRAKDGNVFTTGWVRPIDRGAGDRALARLDAAGSCPAN